MKTLHIFISLLIVVNNSLASAFITSCPSPSSFGSSLLHVDSSSSCRNDVLARNRRRNFRSSTSVVLSVTSLVPWEDLLSQQLLISANSGGDMIQQAFSIATFLPQPFWVFMIVLPNSSITKQIMGDYKVVTLFCLLHLSIVLLSVLEPNGTAPLVEFADVFNPDGNPQGAMVHMMTYPNFVSEEWSHVLTWDLLIGRWIWLDGLRRNIFTSHSVLLANLIGPPGLLLHFATCAITGKEILLGNEMNEITKD
jgi:hypothetical protein